MKIILLFIRMMRWSLIIRSRQGTTRHQGSDLWFVCPVASQQLLNVSLVTGGRSPCACEARSR